MIVLSFDPHAEEDALTTALREFRTRGAQTHSPQAVVALWEALARAEAVCVELEQSSPAPQSGLELVRILLRLRLAAARAELARVHQKSIEEGGPRLIPEVELSASSPLLFVSTGTLPRCPSCEEERGQHIRKEAQAGADSSSPRLSPGTILSCPQCEEGLYTVTTPASVADLVLDDGVLLQPLNPTIPQREAWRALACPKCGGRYYKEGRLHTVQAGWQ